MSSNPFKDIALNWNGVDGALHLEADLTAGDIQRIMKNVLKIDPRVGFSLDSINYEEYIVQMAQKMTKTAPTGFEIDKPDNFRKLKPSVWGEIEDFIGDNYALMDFLERGLKVIFGKKYLAPNSQG